MAIIKPQSNGSLYGNTVIGTLAVDGCAVTFGTEGPGWAAAPPSPLFAVPNNNPPQQLVYQLHIIRCGTIIASEF